MSAAKKLNLVSVEDYLAGELVSPVKHEYLGGVVYAMAGARNVHNIIKGNIFASLHVSLRNSKCQPFDSDTKIRIRLPAQVRFYYPDVSVICRPNSQDDSFQDAPTIIFEVISRRTRRIDEGEKKDAYLTIPSLSAYVLVEQTAAAAVVYRRMGRDFVPEVYEGLDAVIPLSKLDGIDVSLALAEVYERVEVRPEPEESTD
jgi:Uma2 family endonuclease